MVFGSLSPVSCDGGGHERQAGHEIHSSGIIYLSRQKILPVEAGSALNSSYAFSLLYSDFFEKKSSKGKAAKPQVFVIKPAN